jgi:sodium-dependent dicarboxylate transporter 2/3/5
MGMKKRKFLFFSLLVLLVVLLFFPADAPIRKGLAILIFTALMWISEALPLGVTSLSVPVLAVLLRISDVKSAFSPFAHPIIFLFLGGFTLAAALSKYDLDRFLAYRIVSFSKGNLLYTSALLMVSTAFISMWISNTSTTAMMLPLALGIIGTIGENKKLSTFILLGVAYSASIGGIGTVVGSPPNGITAANLGMSFIDWMKFGIPMVVVLLPTLLIILILIFKPNLNKKVFIEPVHLKMDKEKWAVLLTFTLTVALWLGSKKISALLGIHKYFDAVVAVLAILLLFSLKLLEWEDLDRSTDWGTLYLFGGGLALSHVLKVTGTSKFLSQKLVEGFGSLPHFLFIVCVSLFIIFMTELMSNTATAAIFIPILIATATSLSMKPETLSIPAGVAASCAFMLPVATPPNALVYGTGLVKQRDMIKAGIILNITFAFIISAIIGLIT